MQETSTVELAYVPTAADAIQAVRAQMRASASGRRLRWLLPTAGALGLLFLALNLAGPGEPHVPLAIMSGGLVLLALGTGLLAPRVMGRAVHRMVEPQGEFRAVVDSDGVRWTARDSETVWRWRMLPRYVETAELFVLLSADKHAVGVAVLPKRGVRDTADLDRLRAVLDRHTARV
ncbi:YcxB family protein [Streptomyces formicae]|uniref:YcxB family protein n=1 Tax=Streptomyces formicae TaxID=1616117 RepID=A0ABY3WQY7_9ACTN|nr:YcxB family protein [Streptomyces formicae]UNM15064.1 YcxB family protein [Streptomyces formicae]